MALLDGTAIKLASGPSKLSKFAAFDDEACALPAKHSMHHGLGGSFRFYNNPKAVRPKAMELAALLDPEPPAVTKPKSYAAVAWPSVITAAPPYAAAVLELSAAASLPSSDLKPSAAASQFAADTAVNFECICGICMCIYISISMCV